MKISILGAGWLGKPLAETLETKHKVQISIRQKGVMQGAEFYLCDALIISLPPRDEYLANIQSILNNTHKNTKIILLSSTSVYSQKAQGQKQILGENIIKDSHPNYLILRLGGLMGYDRIAGKYTQGKEVDSDAYTNYIHRDDVIHIIDALLLHEVKSETFNLVCPSHTQKKEVYENNAKLYDFKSTIFLSLEIKGKQISSKKIVEFLDYEFIYKSPLEFHPI